MRDSVGVAVIGAGMAGRSHAHAYRNAQTVFGVDAPPVRLVAVADINEEFARHAAERYGFERAERSWTALAEAKDVDAVSIVVANDLHREIAEAMLASGKHVLCEKPLASNVEDAEAMVKAADAAGTVAACGFSYRRSPAVSAIGEQLRNGVLGEVISFDGKYWCDYAADPDAPSSWRYTGPLGSGALADLGSHLIDMAEQLCGPIRSVRGAALPTVIPDRPVPQEAVLGHAAGVTVSDERARVTNEDVADFVVEFASGAAGSFSISRVAHGHPNDLGFEVFGTRGAARFDLSRNSEFGFVDSTPDPVTNGWRRVVVGPDHPYVAAAQSMPFPGVGHGGQEFFTYQARAFLDEICGLARLPRPATFADGLRNLRVQEAVVRTVTSAPAIEVPA
ncbi:MAG: putative oxidoreductase [Marmoricola sp.]|nr:putative oxidoreductase [Marmoricola sp.]